MSMWHSLALQAAKGDHRGPGSILMAADPLLFADNGAGSGTAAGANVANAVDASDAADAVDMADAGNGSSANPRKRKKSSRAYCIKHGKKACLYLRPQKKRGPAQGYRSALHTMRESAAAWGVAATLIPNLAPLVAGYLEKAEGRRLVKAIKDPQQQEHFIQVWQQSDVFKLFFPDEGNGGDGGDGGGGVYGGGDGDGGDEPSSDAAYAVRDSRHHRSLRRTSTAEGQEADADDGSASAAEAPEPAPAPAPAPAPTSAPPPPPQPTSAAAAAAAAATRPRPKSFQRLARPLPPRQPPLPSSHDPRLSLFDYHNTEHRAETSAAGTATPTRSRAAANGQGQGQRDGHGGGGGLPDDAAASSLADIMARDAAKSSNSLSNTLGLLGFAADENANDFQAMSYHHPSAGQGAADEDAQLGSEMDQKAYYELLMGKGF